MASEVDKCCVCSASNSKYKCPRCYAKYCSVDCCKTHKGIPCEATVAVKCETVEHDQKFVTDNTVTREKLLMLSESKEVLSLLRSPTLRDQLSKINDSSDPSETLKIAMENSEFDKFASSCLNIVDPLSSVASVEPDLQEERKDLIQTLHNLLQQELSDKV